MVSLNVQYQASMCKIEKKIDVITCLNQTMRNKWEVIIYNFRGETEEWAMPTKLII